MGWQQNSSAGLGGGLESLQTTHHAHTPALPGACSVALVRKAKRLETISVHFNKQFCKMSYNLKVSVFLKASLFKILNKN